jgi:hypothetical protein
MKSKHLLFLCFFIITYFPIKGMLSTQRLARLFPTAKSTIKSTIKPISKPTFPVNKIQINEPQKRNYSTLLKNSAKPSLWIRIKSRIPLTDAYFVRRGAIEGFYFAEELAKELGFQSLSDQSITLKNYINAELMRYQNGEM